MYSSQQSLLGTLEGVIGQVFTLFWILLHILSINKQKKRYEKNTIHFGWYMPWVFVSHLSLAIVKCENAVLQPKRNVSSLSPSGFLQPCLVSLRCT